MRGLVCALLLLTLAPVVGVVGAISAAADPCSSSSATSSNTRFTAQPEAFVGDSDQINEHEDPGCSETEGSGGQRNVVGEECGVVAGPGDADGCTEQVCPGGGASMVSYPVVNGVVDWNRGAYFCADPNHEPTIDSAQVLREIKRIGLPVPKLSVQPPGGKTLVNFDTIFSTSAHEMRPTLTLAGSEVAVHIWPSGFTWHWGDASQQLQTSHAGRAYDPGVPMEDYITHQYVDANVTVRPRVDVTYSAEFRVGNGAWRPVLGTVTIPGEDVALRIVEARPVLVGPD